MVSVILLYDIRMAELQDNNNGSSGTKYKWKTKKKHRRKLNVWTALGAAKKALCINDRP